MDNSVIVAQQPQRRNLGNICFWLCSLLLAFSLAAPTAQAQGVISLTRGSDFVDEGSSVEFTVTISAAATADLTVPINIDITQVASFFAPTFATAQETIISSGQSDAIFTLSVANNATDSPVRDVVVAVDVDNLPNYLPPAAGQGDHVATVRIVDNDDPPELAVGTAQESNTGSTGRQLVFALTLARSTTATVATSDPLSAHTIVVAYTTSDQSGADSPKAGTDYEATSGTLTFMPLTTDLTREIVVPILPGATANMTEGDFDLELTHHGDDDATFVNFQGGTAIAPSAASQQRHGSMLTLAGAIKLPPAPPPTAPAGDTAERANDIILPYIAMALADETTDAVRRRIASALQRDERFTGLGASRAAFSAVSNSSGGQAQGNASQGAGHQGLTLRGQSPLDFLVSQARQPAEVFLPGMAKPRQRQPDLNLGDIAFSLSVAGGDAAGNGRSLTVWGNGYQLGLSVNPTEDPINFDGTAYGNMFGVDAVMDNYMVGVALSSSSTKMDYNHGEGQNINRGTHETSVTALHPYFGLRWDNGAHMWASMAYGTGDAEAADQSNPNDRFKEDVRLNVFALGGHYPFRDWDVEGRVTNLSVVADGILASMRERGQGQVDQFSSNRMRFGVEMDHQRPLDDGGDFGGSLRMAYRIDSGHALTGNGLEIGGSFNIALPAGLRFNFGAKTLMAYSQNANEWAVSGGVEWARQVDGMGFSLAFRPSWGQGSVREGQLWSNGVSQASGLSNGPASLRYNLEVKYGLALADADELVTFFARSHFNDSAHSYGLGADFNLGAALSFGYEAAVGHAGNTLAVQANNAAYEPLSGTQLSMLNPATSSYQWMLHPNTAGPQAGSQESSEPNNIDHRLYLRYQKRF